MSKKRPHNVISLHAQQPAKTLKLYWAEVVDAQHPSHGYQLVLQEYLGKDFKHHAARDFVLTQAMDFDEAVRNALVELNDISRQEERSNFDQAVHYAPYKKDGVDYLMCSPIEKNSTVLSFGD